jgi:hypothetical protein
MDVAGVEGGQDCHQLRESLHPQQDVRHQGSTGGGAAREGTAWVLPWLLQAPVLWQKVDDVHELEVLDPPDNLWRQGGRGWLSLTPDQQGWLVLRVRIGISRQRQGDRVLWPR